MKGKKVLITRSAEDNKDFKEQLEKKGVEVIEAPMIRFELAEDLTVIHEQLEQLEAIDWIVFTSAKTVEFFFEIAERKGIKFYYYPDLKIATVGEKTKLKLEQLGYRTNFVPIQYTAEVLAENMDENIEGKRILIIYETLPVAYTIEDFETVMNQKIDYLTFTSGSTFDAFYENMLGAKIDLTFEKIICIGPSTAKVVEQKGFDVSILAAPHTTEGMIKAIEKLEEHV